MRKPTPREQQYLALLDEVRERFRATAVELRESGDEEAAKTYDDVSEETLIGEVYVITQRQRLFGVAKIILRKYVASGRLVLFDDTKSYVCTSGKPWDVVVDGKKYVWKASS